MMKIAQKGELSEVLNYLKKGVEDCIYMYIDIKKYGFDNPNMKVWVDFDSEGINLVVMKYHTSISVCARAEGWDVIAVADLIRAESVESVTSTKRIVEMLQEALNDEYNAAYGYVFQLTDYLPMQFDGIIERANEGDTREIAALIKLDEDIGGYYQLDDLALQLSERMKTGMGRSYVIRDHKKIIAHIASYAECDGIATTGGLIVDPEYQNGTYGAVLEGYLVNKLREEGFKVYTFVTARMRKIFLTTMGNSCVGEYGKMVLKK